MARLAHEQASAAPCEPSSAAADARGGEAEAAPEPGMRRPLRPHELKVAAALCMVLRAALKEGRATLERTMEILACNHPPATTLLQLVPNDGRFFSLKQLEGSLGAAARDWLGFVSEQCAAAECQPLDLFTRSAQCTTHLRALQSKQSGAHFAARLKQLQAIQTSLSVSGPVESIHQEIQEALMRKIELLAEHGVAQFLISVIIVALDATVILLGADRLSQLRAYQMMAGSRTSFVACIDHMLPGEQSQT